MDGEERVLATAQQIVQTLGSQDESMKGTAIEILTKFDGRFNDQNLTAGSSSRAGSDMRRGLANALDGAERVIVRWENAPDRMVWDSEEEALTYLNAVDEVQNVLDSLSLQPESSSRAGTNQETTDRAQGLLEAAMIRLEQEFRYLVSTNSTAVDVEWLLRATQGQAGAAAAQGQAGGAAAQGQAGATAAQGQAGAAAAQGQAGAAAQGGAPRRQSDGASTSAGAPGGGFFTSARTLWSKGYERCCDKCDRCGDRCGDRCRSCDKGGDSLTSRPFPGRFIPSDDDDDENVPVAQPVRDLQPVLDLIPEEVIRSLHDIARRMIHGGRQAECIEEYSSVRREMLWQSLRQLGMDKLSVEEVQRVQWEVLQGRIQRWVQVMEVSVMVLFASEKQMCEQVFDRLPGDAEELCFRDVAKGAMMQLLNFGEAVAISRRSTDKLIDILDMYKKLRQLMPDIISTFAGEAGIGVREAASGVQIRLGEAVRATLAEFENDVKRDPPKNPVPGGALHPLSRYVMNYLRLLLVYIDTLKQILGERSSLPLIPGEASSSSYERSLSGSSGSGSGYYPSEASTSSDTSNAPITVQFVWIIHLLQNNLELKAKLYKDLALTNLFLMNNGRYIERKVRESELAKLLGDDWIRRQTTLVRQYATAYQRSAWVRPLSFLREADLRAEGTSVRGGGGGAGLSSGVSKAVLKERFKHFNAAVEEACKTQAGWVVPDERLAVELRVAVSQRLLPAYTSFLTRYGFYLDGERHRERYIRYTPEALDTLVNDLFGGAAILPSRAP